MLGIFATTSRSSRTKRTGFSKGRASVSPRRARSSNLVRCWHEEGAAERFEVTHVQTGEMARARSLEEALRHIALHHAERRGIAPARPASTGAWVAPRPTERSETKGEER